MLGIVETISRQFVNGGTSNNTKKKHLQAIMNLEHNKGKE